MVTQIYEGTVVNCWETEMTADEHLKKLNDAANDFCSYLISTYKDDKGVHSETIIGALGAITGEHILKASTPGVENLKELWVFSDTANKLLFEGTDDITILDVVQLASGLADKEMPDIKEIILRTAKAVGGSPFPPLTIPSDNYPYEWSPNAAFEHRSKIMQISQKHELTDRDRALALGLATGKMIQLSEKVLDKKIAIQLALEVMVGCTKIAPLTKRFG